MGWGVNNGRKTFETQANPTLSVYKKNKEAVKFVERTTASDDQHSPVDRLPGGVYGIFLVYCQSLDIPGTIQGYPENSHPSKYSLLSVCVKTGSDPDKTSSTSPYVVGSHEEAEGDDSPASPTA